MTLPSDKYWSERSLERLTEAERRSLPYMREIQQVYKLAAKRTVEQVKEMYAAYYAREGFDSVALDKVATNGDIKRFLKDMANAGLDTRLPDNYKGKMSRLEMMHAQMWGEINKAAKKEIEISGKSYRKTFSNSYYRSVYDTIRGTKMPNAFSVLDTRIVEKVLQTKFYGSRYSERVWRSTDKLAGSLHEILGKAIATGQAPAKTIQEVMERFGVKQYEAARLVRTETNYFENQAELEAYEELNIERYQFIATLDERTSDICREHDHKVYLVKEAKQGENVPPLHPNCRSAIKPYFGEEYESKYRIARNAKGENYLTANQPYNSWLKEVQTMAATGATSVTSGPTMTGRLADSQIMSNIGVTPEYWRNNMEPGERSFARTYGQEHDIAWIDKLSRKDPDTGVPLETNDYKVGRTMWELKTPSKKLKYSSISSSISRAAKSGYKKNFMINLGSRRLTKALEEKLSNYNLVHGTKIRRLHVWSRGKEIVIKLKK